jgi:acetyltransferase-like isoleucine patch superfamily enzyme
MILLIIGLILLVYFLDNLTIYFYTKRQKYKIQIDSTEDVIETSMQITEKTFKSKLIDNGYLLFQGWIRYKLRNLGKIPCHSYRIFCLRHIYHMTINKNVVIYGGFEIRDPWKIAIDEGTIIGDECKLDGRNKITMGKNVNLSTGVWIWTEQHDLRDPNFRCNSKGGEVRIDDYTWISSRATILPNTVINKGVVIGANALVTKECEDYGVYGGVPARKISERPRNLEYEFDGSHIPFY